VHDRVDSPYSRGNVQRWVEGRSLREIVAPSFDEVEAAARSGLFDTLGHLDVVKRYLHPYVPAGAFADAPDLYEPILRALVDSGTALEINTSGLRHPVAETYPSAAIVGRFQELGGRAVTVGSDAHRATHFGWALADGYQYAMDAGFEALTFRRGGDRIQVPIRNRVPLRS
jgi:histidinol-phosphatase (PHP family)